jgi:predicted PurR-regulated permease PerM
MNKIKLILICVVTVILIALGITVAIQSKKISNLNESLSNSVNNEKSLLLKNDNNENEIRSLKLSVEQLDYFNDSITEKLNQARKELKVKDADLKELQYLQTLATKTDTVFIPDTIFVEKTNLDTTMGDEWYQLNLQL